MERGQSRPYALKAGEGATYALGPEFVVKAGELGQGRRVAFVEFTTRAGEEPEPHTHATEDEIFYVIEGAQTIACGGESFDLEARGFVLLPRGVEHTYTVKGGGDVRMIIVTTPADEEASGSRSGGWGGFIGDVEREG